MLLRETSLLPHIPGLPALLSMLFAPVMELRYRKPRWGRRWLPQTGRQAPAAGGRSVLGGTLWWWRTVLAGPCPCGHTVPAAGSGAQIHQLPQECGCSGQRRQWVPLAVMAALGSWLVSVA